MQTKKGERSKLDHVRVIAFVETKREEFIEYTNAINNRDHIALNILCISLEVLKWGRVANNLRE